MHDPEQMESRASQRSGALPFRLESRRRLWRRDISTELALAIPPTLTVLAVTVLIQGFTHQKLLFASLASSSFLIYYDPQHRMNTVRVMAGSQLLACGLGLAGAHLLGGGYLAAGLSMTLTILLCVVLDVVHPPSISTALAFGFVPPQPQTVVLFVLALGVVTLLVVTERAAVWLAHRAGL